MEACLRRLNYTGRKAHTSRKNPVESSPVWVSLGVVLTSTQPDVTDWLVREQATNREAWMCRGRTIGNPWSTTTATDPQIVPVRHTDVPLGPCEDKTIASGQYRPTWPLSLACRSLEHNRELKLLTLGKYKPADTPHFGSKVADTTCSVATLERAWLRGGSALTPPNLHDSHRKVNLQTLPMSPNHGKDADGSPG